MTEKRQDGFKVSSTSPTAGLCQKIGLRVPEAAFLIGANPGHIEQKMREGVLPYRIIGQERVIAYEDLREYFYSIPVETGPRREPKAATQARKHDHKSL